MIKRDQIIDFINKILSYEKDKDPYGPNSLQVIGCEDIKKIVLGVSANLDLFKKAAQWDADIIIVHHGLFWNKDERIINRLMKARLKVLFDSDITLLGYHFFLDNHPSLGNNAQIIKLLGAKKGEEFGTLDKLSWGYEATFLKQITIDELIKRCKKLCGPNAKVFKYGPKFIKKFAVVSGGGGSNLLEAIDKNLDAYITGDARESTEAQAKEAGIHHIFFGHYNSEKFGVFALREVLKKKFPSLEIKFIDIPNPL
jgi:dinuclear metal center YbgI/SA1388 family protein